MWHISRLRRFEYPVCWSYFSLFRRPCFHWLGVTRKPKWIVAHDAIVFHCTSRWQSFHAETFMVRGNQYKNHNGLAIHSRKPVVNQCKRVKTRITSLSNRFLPATKICVTNRVKHAYLLYLINTYNSYYSVEPAFWHRYVIMAAKIVSKFVTLLNMWVPDHRFTVTSPWLCDIFPKFGDWISHCAFTNMV